MESNTFLLEIAELKIGHSQVSQAQLASIYEQAVDQ